MVHTPAPPCSAAYAWYQIVSDTDPLNRRIEGSGHVPSLTWFVPWNV